VKFGTMTQFEPLEGSTVINLKYQKSKMPAAVILEIEKSPYLGNGLTDRHEIWQVDAVRTS